MKLSNPLRGLLRGSNVSKRSKLRSITLMDLNTLQEFRHGMYHCFGNAKDALFNLVDALSSEAGASSFPELSFSPFFEGTWASCMKLWKTARSMPSDCARSLWT